MRSITHRKEKPSKQIQNGEILRKKDVGYITDHKLKKSQYDAVAKKQFWFSAVLISLIREHQEGENPLAYRNLL